MKYRNKHTGEVIEALRFDPSTKPQPKGVCVNGPWYYIRLAGGGIRLAATGDYIVYDQGEPMDILAGLDVRSNYEPVEDAPQPAPVDPFSDWYRTLQCRADEEARLDAIKQSQRPTPISRPAPQGVFMKSLVRKAMVAWCLYGVVKLCIFVNPWVFKVVGMIGIRPADGGPLMVGNIPHTVVVWAVALLCSGATIGLLALANYAYKSFAAWLFSK